MLAVSPCAYLVSQRNPQDALPALGPLDALQVALLEAEVGQRRHRIPPRDGTQDADWDLILADDGRGIWVRMFL